MNINFKKLSLLLIFLLLIGAEGIAERLSFFYFNPDSAQNNLSQLKSDMDAVLLQNQQDISFQPFSRLSDFDQQLRTKTPSLIYVPYWYLQRYGKELGIRPLFYSLRENKTTYLKQLITNINSTKNIQGLRDGTLAMTTLGPDSRRILNNIIFNEHNIDAKKISIIEVPKDADAIFAVALGQVDSAIVSKSSLQLLKQRNPRLTAAVQVIADTKPINLPVLCYLEGSITENKLKELRQQRLTTKPQSDKNIFSVLNIDAWKPQS